MKVVLRVTIIVGLLAIVAAALAYGGAFNVAASDPHSGTVASVLSTIQVQSVRTYAKRIEAPPLSDPQLAQVGLHHYQEMCVTCHGAPGVDPSEIGKGLNPRPPDLSDAVKEYKERELYWIIKHGIKMTGMPAFGATHSDEELWGIVAFLQRLPQLSAEEYQAMTSSTGDQHTDHSHGHAERTAENAEQAETQGGSIRSGDNAGSQERPETQPEHHDHQGSAPHSHASGAPPHKH